MGRVSILSILHLLLLVFEFVPQFGAGGIHFVCVPAADFGEEAHGDGFEAGG